MKKSLITKLTIAAIVTTGLAGCNATMSEANKNACSQGTSYGGAALGALAGGVVGSLVGKGSGNTIATVGGIAAGGYMGSKSDVGCE